MPHEIRWTRTALRRVEEIADYIAKDSPEAARKVVERLFESMELHRDHPRATSRFPSVDDECLRQKFVGRYRIIFRIYDDRKLVRVLTVQHTSQRALGEDDLPDR